MCIVLICCLCNCIIHVPVKAKTPALPHLLTSRWYFILLASKCVTKRWGEPVKFSQRCAAWCIWRCAEAWFVMLFINPTGIFIHIIRQFFCSAPYSVLATARLVLSASLCGDVHLIWVQPPWPSLTLSLLIPLSSAQPPVLHQCRNRCASHSLILFSLSLSVPPRHSPFPPLWILFVFVCVSN